MLLLLLLISSQSLSADGTNLASHQNASLDRTHYVSLSKAHQVDFIVPTVHLINGAFRLSVTSSAFATSPVTVTLQHRESIESWTVSGMATIARTLCPPPSLSVERNDTEDFIDTEATVSKAEVETVTLTLTTQSRMPVLVEFTGQLVSGSNFTLTAGSFTDFSVNSPDSPRVFAVRLPPGAGDALLAFESTSAGSCARVSLRRHRCPLHEYRGLISTQTLTTSGHLLARSHLEEPIQFVTIELLYPNDDACSGTEASDLGKNFTLAVNRIVPLQAAFPVSLSAFCFLLVFALAPACAYICWRRQSPSSDGPEQQQQRHELKLFHNIGQQESGERAHGSPCSRDCCDCPVLPEGADIIESLSAQSSESEQDKVQTSYCFHVVVVAVFYSLPAVQLVLTSQKWLHETGDQDRCYYNFACLLPMSVFGYTIYASNSVVSNLGYVILGATFLVCVSVHRRAWRRRHQESGCRQRCGVPPSHGLHYAAGFGMVTEGLLSAGYHMCPSATSFQFDTAFMLLLAGLLALLVMTKRRPALRPPAHWGCLGFSGLILLNTLGSAPGPAAVRCAVFSATGALLLAGARFTHLETVSNGEWRRRNCQSAAALFFLPWRVTQSGGPRRQSGRANSAFQIVFSCLCVLEAATALATAALPELVKSYSMFLLGCLLLNISFYLVYYLARKLQSIRFFLGTANRKKCRIHRGLGRTAVAASAVCLLVAIAMWSAALMLFVQAPTDWKLAPAQSRERNSRCLALGYFDVHDIWHFASALALFFSFLFLLTIDDDVAAVPRDRLEAF